MRSRQYLVGVILAALLVWGPIPSLLIRIAYLIAIPVLTWLLLGRLWRTWKPSERAEDLLGRGLALVTALVLGAWAAHMAMKPEHVGNMQVIQTRDGTDEVGDRVVREGPDWRGVVTVSALAAFAGWFGLSRQKHR